MRTSILMVALLSSFPAILHAEQEPSPLILPKAVAASRTDQVLVLSGVPFDAQTRASVDAHGVRVHSVSPHSGVLLLPALGAGRHTLTVTQGTSTLFSGSFSASDQFDCDLFGSVCDVFDLLKLLIEIFRFGGIPPCPSGQICEPVPVLIGNNGIAESMIAKLDSAQKECKSGRFSLSIQKLEELIAFINQHSSGVCSDAGVFSPSQIDGCLVPFLIQFIDCMVHSLQQEQPKGPVTRGDKLHGLEKQVVDMIKKDFVDELHRATTSEEIKKLIEGVLKGKKGLAEDPRNFLLLIESVEQLLKDAADDEKDQTRKGFLNEAALNAGFLKQVEQFFVNVTNLKIAPPIGIVVQIDETNAAAAVNEAAKADVVWKILDLLRTANIIKEIDDQLTGALKGKQNPVKACVFMEIRPPNLMTHKLASGTTFWPVLPEVSGLIRMELDSDQVKDGIALRWILIHELLHAKARTYDMNGLRPPFDDVKHDDGFKKELREKYTELRKKEGKTDEEIKKEIEELEAKFSDPESGKK